MESGFFAQLEACFNDNGQKKVSLALVCDRGGFGFGCASLNTTLKHVVVDFFYPASNNRPYGSRKEAQRSHVAGHEAALSTTVAGLRAFDEIDNLNFAQNRIYRSVIPIAFFYLLDFIDDVAFSMANMGSNCPRANERRN